MRCFFLYRGMKTLIHQRIVLLTLTLLFLSACAHLGFPTYYDPITYKNLTDIKPEVVFLYESFTSDSVDTNKITSIRLKLAKIYEYEKGKGVSNKETKEQVEIIQEMFEEHVKDRLTKGKWNQAHLNNQRKNISDAFDIAIRTERLKNKNE